MKILKASVDIDEFFEKLSASDRSLLLLDFDGTLAPFHEDRMQVRAYPGIPELLSQIMKETPTRVIIVTGRTIDVFRNLFQIDPLPEIWGSHGSEHLKKGSYYREQLESDQEESLKHGLKIGLGHMPLSQCEFKPTSVTVHFRGYAQNEVDRLEKIIKEEWGHIKGINSLKIDHFDGGLELKASGVSKGKAIKKILNEIDMNDIPIAYLGDDLTDEEAFQELGDRALKVLVRKELRETVADVKINPPEELFTFLEKWKTCTSKKDRK